MGKARSKCMDKSGRCMDPTDGAAPNKIQKPEEGYGSLGPNTKRQQTLSPGKKRERDRGAL